MLISICHPLSWPIHGVQATDPPCSPAMSDSSLSGHADRSEFARWHLRSFVALLGQLIYFYGVRATLLVLPQRCTTVGGG